MTPVRLNKIITVAMSCLFAAITIATANSVMTISGPAQSKGAVPTVKDDETDSAASGIVQKSVSHLRFFFHLDSLETFVSISSY